MKAKRLKQGKDITDLESDDEKKKDKDGKVIDRPMKMTEQFEEHMALVNKLDTTYEKLLNVAKMKAMKESDFKMIEDLKNNKLDRQALDKYLNPDSEKNLTDLDLEKLNKEYTKDLEDTKYYQEYWTEIKRPS